MTDVPPPPPVQPAPTATTGASSTTILAAVASVRRLVLVSIVALIVVAGLLAGLALATRATLVDTNDRLAQVQAQLAAAGTAAQPTAAPTAQPSERAVEPAVALADVATPAGADEAGALLIGNPDAGTVVEVFFDFQCPYCQKWHQQLGAGLEAQALAADSDLLVKVNPMAFLMESDTINNPGASARAANAMACVADTADAQALSAFSAAVFAAADPAEPPGQFPAEQLVELATASGAGEAAGCIETEQFVPYVAAVTQAAFGRGATSTPTVLVNGQTLANPFDVEELQALLASG